MKKLIVGAALASLLFVPSTAPAQANRDQVWAAGSSTVFPFTTRVAESFARKTGRRAPRVEALGTGGGFKAFCAGVGPNTPDLANASRRIKPSEWETCRKNGVGEIVEIKIGYDGLVIANRRADPTFDLKLAHLYLALSKDVLRFRSFERNPYTNWAQIGQGLPSQRILVYGPPPTSGTRDSFVELGLEHGAERFPTMKALKGSNEQRFKQLAGTIREDGLWVDAGENDNAIVQMLIKTPGALGVFGYSFYEQNRDSVKAATIDGVAPTPQTIADGSYPIARSMYIYVKKAHVGVVPGLREFVQEFVSDAAMGRGGYLQQRGLVTLTGADLAQQQRNGRELVAMTAPPK